MRTRQITDRTEIEAIISKCQWCHMAMVGPGNQPYVIPMNYGYREGVIYLHGAQKGKKIDSFKAPDGPGKKDAEIAYQKGECERSFTWLKANA